MLSLKYCFLFLDLYHKMMDTDKLSSDRQRFERLLRENLLKAMIILYKLSQRPLHVCVCVCVREGGVLHILNDHIVHPILIIFDSSVKSSVKTLSDMFNSTFSKQLDFDKILHSFSTKWSIFFTELISSY